MTVLDSTPRDQYTATSGQTVFPYTFEIAAAGDIKVLQNGTLIDQGAGAGEYAVSGVGVDTGGNVTLVTGATTGDVLTIYRDMALERLTAYTNAGDFLAADVNNDYDRLWLALQQNTGVSNRALVAPNTDPTSIDMTIPAKADRLDKYLKFDVTTGNPEVADPTALFTAAGLNNYNFTGDGATVNFTLGMEPGAENNTQVYIDGVYQQKDTYNVSGAVVQFSAAPPNLSTIEVMVIEVLPVGSTTASQVSFTQASSTYGRNVQLKLQETVSVEDFGAIGDGVTDDTAAIQAAIDNANGLYFPYGTYLVSAQINLKSNLSITADIGAKILLGAGVTPYVLRGTSISNVSIVNLEIEGNGASGYSTIYIDNSSNIYINNCKITKSGATGLYFVACSFVKVENCELSNNYYYGLEFRDSDDCKAFANLCAENGDTGVATSTGGRGIMLWRSRSCYIAGNRLSLNTEYGFRIYSEAADTTTSNYNVVTGNVFLDNTRADLVLYDEGVAFSFVSRNVISDNIFYRSVDTTDLNTVCVLHGDFNTYVNNHIHKSGAFGTDCGFNFYNANYCTINNCSVENMAQAFSTSSSTNITIDNCFGNGVANGLIIPTEDIFVNNCRFIHGGTGITDTCIDNTTATGKNFYRDNYLSGFYRGFSIDDTSIALFRNTTLSSSDAGLNKSGDVTSTIEAGDNSWDSATPFLLSAFSRTSSTHDQAEVRYPAAPTILTWTRGDIVYNEEPSASGSIGFVCVTAGTPGTWKTFGAISA